MTEGGGSTLYDVSGYKADGTITTPTWLFGPSGLQLDFPGTSYVDCGNNAIFAFGAGGFSVCARVRLDSNSAGGAFPAIIEKGNGDWTDGGASKTGWWIGHVDSDNWSFRVGDGTVGQDIVNLVSETAYPTIYFFVGSATSTRIIAYRNGISVADIARTKTGSTDTSQNLNIGRWRQFDRKLDGAISEIRIYNRALTPGEVKSLYENPFLEFEQPRKYFFLTPSDVSNNLFPHLYMRRQYVRRYL